MTTTDTTVHYTIGEVEAILGVKAHVIRYWEKEFPLVQPEKDRFNGRMRFTEKDIQLLLRIKYLLHERRFTVPGAREQLYLELGGDSSKLPDADRLALPDKEREFRAQIASLRSDLMEIFFVNKNRE
jgi:DNA-binding transcriptional MerR regulator